LVEREEDRLPCSGAEEMPAVEVEVRWRGRHGGEGSAVESAVAEVAQRSMVVEIYPDTAVR
jgi:hypothetical protein